MKALAGFIMRGRMAAILFVAGTSLVPLLAWLGGAALSLVNLHGGGRQGALVMGSALLLVAAVEMLLTGHAGGAIALALLVWMPVLLATLVLRVTVSLPLALMTAVGLAGLGLIAWYLAVADPETFWRLRLEGLAEDVDQAQKEQMMAFFGHYLAVFVALGLLLNVVVGLLLGRAWQAALYNPGGFRREFHALRFDRRLALLALGLLFAATFTGPGLVYDLALLLAALFLLQALAVAHAVVHGRGWNVAVLVLAYILVPVAFLAVALLGMLDSLLDFRRRLLQGAGPGG